MIVLVRPDRLDRLTPNLKSPNELASQLLIGNQPETRLTLLDRVFAVPNYQRIPSAWGKSFDSLQAMLQPVKTIETNREPALQDLHPEGGNRFVVTGDRPSLTFNLAQSSSNSVNGNQVGLLSFDFTCENLKTTPTLAVRWGSQPSVNQVQFTPQTGKQLVPLDAAPRWLLAKNLQSVRVDLLPANACAALKLDHLSWYQRAEVADDAA
jgi:hypothetical protein